MKMKSKILKCTLMLVAASVLSLRALPNDNQPSSFFIGQADTPPPAASSEWTPPTCAETWQELQDKMACLTANPSLENQGLFDAEAAIIGYRSALALRDIGLESYDYSMAIGAMVELLNVDACNPFALTQTSLEFGDFWNALLHARAGATLNDQSTFSNTNDLYKRYRPLQDKAQSDDEALSQARLAENRDENLIKKLINDLKDDYEKIRKAYTDGAEKFQKEAHVYRKAELQDAVTAAALTPEEQQSWNSFESTLTAKYKAALKNYRANPTFAAFPGIEIDLLNLDRTNPAAQLQVRLEIEGAVDANISTFKLLKQGCLYEYLNVLLTKRNDHDSSLNSFHQLQTRLDQFLNNVDVRNPVAALQAQVDMLAYEKEVSAL